MRENTIVSAINKYLKHIMTSSWVADEAYKFEFANYIFENVDWNNQTDEEILTILRKSQELKYTNSKQRGIQFIIKSGKEDLSNFITLSDIGLFREFNRLSFEEINWDRKNMSFTGLSAWISSLFPEKLYPIPMKGFNETINYLFETQLKKYPKTGEKYILESQKYLRETENYLRQFPLEDIHLTVWNKFFKDNPELNIKEKKCFTKLDWIWLTQDFHLFIHREILNLYKPKKIEKIDSKTITESFEPVGIEGNSKLAVHMRYERDTTLILKIKRQALLNNPMLNCEVCGFSFYEKYGELGQGFIEAHHKTPLSDTKTKTKTTINDIALLCSNCHKMIHKGISESDNTKIMNIEELRRLIE